ncbi:MAG: AMMECR1 domain-containing protein [Firmicutes bacterium HGW-Firmicutes-13]|nr:MAG: AMMECR1 domain-containing protein [Firmicutes bacterium HGW-Firmicutes-13]
MSSIVIATISPHPPIIIPAVGRRELEKVSKTVEAMRNMARKVKEADPDTVIIITPHGPVFQNAVAIMGGAELTGSLAQFGASDIKFRVPNDEELMNSIIQEAGAEDIPVVNLDEDRAEEYDVYLELDHGAMVPMYYLKEENITVPFVHITMGLLSYPDLFSFGKALQRAALKSNKRAAVVASGDLSHCLIYGAPAGYNPSGKEFDCKIVELLKEYQVDSILNLDPRLINNAGECGYRPIIMTLGSLDGYEVEPQIMSYEGPFGVGYLVAVFKVGKYIKENEAGDKYRREELAKIKEKQERESSFVRLARQVLEKYIDEGIKPELSDTLPEEFKVKAGVFVSLKKKGLLRGCIGTIEPTRSNVAEEIMQNVLSAALSDPRFPPVTEEELPYLTYSVDVLTPAEPVKGPEELDPEKYGVIVKSGHRTGLLLPNLEGINTAEEQVNIAREKAGIPPGEKMEFFRFKVNRYH